MKRKLLLILGVLALALSMLAATRAAADGDPWPVCLPHMLCP